MRAGLALVLLVYLAYSSFGVAGPFLWGHHGYHGATYMLRALTSLRFHLVTPANWCGYETPPPSSYYLHHPIGYHHVLTVLIPIFGNHEWVARGAAALGGVVLLGVIYALVRRWWSREAGLLAVAVYVGLPMVTAFSVLSDPMMLELACTVVLVDRYLRYLDEPRARTLRAACIAIALGGLLMWEVYFQAVMHAAHGLARLVTRQGRRARVRLFGREWNATFAWIAGTGLTASATMGFHLVYVWRTGVGSDMESSFKQRHDAAFSFVKERLTEWLDILYGRPLVGLGLAWLALFVVRGVVGRARRRDQAVLITFLINSLYYVLFPEGAAVHLYRVYYYSLFLALAVTDLASDLYATVAWLTAKARGAPRSLAPRVAAGVTLVAVAAYFVVETPRAWRDLLESREKMGTFGLPSYNADYTKQLFAMEVARRTGPEDFIVAHANIPKRIEWHYYLDRSTTVVQTLAQLPSVQKQHPRSVVVMDANVAGTERGLMLDLLRQHPAEIFDRYIFIDLRDGKPGIHEYQFKPQPMSLGWRWFVSHRYPPMKAVPVATQLSACADVAESLVPPGDMPPPGEPGLNNAELSSCFYNFTRLRGDDKTAAAFFDRLRKTMLPRDAALGPWAHVVGLRPTGRTGAELWLQVPARDGKAPPRPALTGMVMRWRLQRRAAPSAPHLPVGSAGAPVVIEQPLAAEPSLEAARAGFVLFERVAWSVAPGWYDVSVELGAPNPDASFNTSTNSRSKAAR